MNLGLIGYGTIGRAVAIMLDAGRVPGVNLKRILVRDPDKIDAADYPKQPCSFTTDVSEFLECGLNLVVEAAGHSALKDYAGRVLLSGVDLIAVSGGALADDAFREAVDSAARKSGRRLLVPSGAIAGLDAISAASFAGMDEVTVSVRKSPAAWTGTPAESAARNAVSAPVMFYEGKAREAVAAFPQNINVVAALSFAGVGLDRTTVRMYADPLVKHNTFEVHAAGEFGELNLTVGNRPFPDNPKTGHLVVFSILKSIQRMRDTIVVGF